MLVLILIRRKKYDLSIFKSTVIFLYITLLGTVGAKILSITENLINRLTSTGGEDLLAGFSYYGAVFLVFFLIGPLGRTVGLKPEKGRDLAAVCVMSQAAFMRVGCFFNGCCGGWTAKINETVFTWPTQLIECFCDFLIIAWLLYCEKKGRGLLYPRFMLTYSTVRFFLEFFRDTPKNWLWLSHGQWFAIIAIVLSEILIYRKKRRSEDGKRRRQTK